MPPLLWTILEILFGYWIFRNRRKIQRGVEFVLAPPPLETETLPHADDNPTLGGMFAGAFIGLMANNFGMFKPPLFTLGSMTLGAVGMGLLFHRMNQCVQQLAPNQPWRVLTESLAARAGIKNVTVRMARSKSQQVRVSPKGVVTLPSALLRNSTPDELAFHIGRALWEIPSGYVKNQTNKISRSASLHVIVGALISAILTENTINLSPMILAAFSFLFSVFYISIRLDKAIYAADRFALGLTGDFPAALRSIGPDKPRTESLSDWWTRQQRLSPPGTTYGQTAPQVQRLGKP